VTSLPSIDTIFDEYELLEGEDRYRLLIDLGRQLETSVPRMSIVQPCHFSASSAKSIARE